LLQFSLLKLFVKCSLKISVSVIMSVMMNEMSTHFEQCWQLGILKIDHGFVRRRSYSLVVTYVQVIMFWKLILVEHIPCNSDSRTCDTLSEIVYVRSTSSFNATSVQDEIFDCNVWHKSVKVYDLYIPIWLMIHINNESPFPESKAKSLLYTYLHTWAVIQV
jgi:hypothetical protein